MFSPRPTAVAVALSLSLCAIARADVVGRLRVTVRNAADEKPVAGAKVTFKDSAGSRADVVLTTGPDGVATTPLLENRSWKVTVRADGFDADERDVTVVSDVTTDVEALLEPLTEKVVRITAARELLRPGDTSGAVRRDRSFLERYPATAGNRQSLTKAIRTVPGFVENSVNQAHPRGEHASTSVYINGFLLPGAFQGRAGQVLAPDAVETMDVLTGAYAPEYGGETAAVLNLSLRAGTLTPFADYSVAGGGFGTFEGVLTAGGRTGTDNRFGYLFNFTHRRTDNGLEPPQPDRQSVNNRLVSSTAFGNLQYNLRPGQTLSLLFNTAPARSDVANRTGLPERFAPYGGGFGYGGALDADEGLESQEEKGQRVYQRDDNQFTTLQYRGTDSRNIDTVFSLGFSRSVSNILNETDDPTNTNLISSAALPENSSLEFHPTIRRRSRQLQFQGSVTVPQGVHTLKFGALYSDQSGRESYRLVPGSQTALDHLFALDPRLAPAGGTVIPHDDDDHDDDGGGNERVGRATRGVGHGSEEEPDRYQLDTPSAVPTLSVRRSGYYAAAYAQDTFRATPKLTLNYGARVDSYRGAQDLGQEAVRATELSPRINAAYQVAPRTLWRASYNRLFSVPPQAQGAILGASIKPQISNMVETSVERQLPDNQVVKLAGYRKWNRNQLDTAILVEGTQIGAFTTINIERSMVAGVELSYDKQPRGGVGLGGYLTWSNITAKPNQPFPDAFNDHDQRNTVSAGLTYAHAGGATAGVNFVYGSGIFSGAYDGKRHPRKEVNLSLSSGPRREAGGLKFDLSVENLFDQRQVINFLSPFSGTRFQQGRRVMLSLSGKF